jgi:hypothetical protein
MLTPLKCYQTNHKISGRSKKRKTEPLGQRLDSSKFIHLHTCSIELISTINLYREILKLSIKLNKRGLSAVHSHLKRKVVAKLIDQQRFVG